MIFLSEYIDNLVPLEILNRSGDDVCIEGIANNSKQVKSGFIFCAIRGAKADGRKFIGEAMENGAAAIVSDDPFLPIPDAMPYLIVQNAYHAWGKLCEVFAGNPAGFMELHAVTGTNGKTTTAYLLRSLLSKATGKKCGLITTVEYDSCGASGLREASRTTPDAMTFQNLLNEMRSNNCHTAVMETSSHGLHQRRTGSSDFATGIFTNLTGDHLDYHKTMDAYFEAKAYLFTDLIRKNGNAVVNTDDPWGKRLEERLKEERKDIRIVPFSVSGNGDGAYAKNIELSASGARFDLFFDGKKVLCADSPFIGMHNVFNLGEALSAALALGIEPENLEKTLKNLPVVPGRLQVFKLGNGASAFVDYAHTDDALERVLTALRPLCEGKILCVFGCGGDRDRTKRPRMGEVAARLSDLPVATSDNPRTENPESILDEIVAGIPKEKNFLRISDREKAIFKALELSKKGDIVLIAGKGHEKTQEINGVKYPFDDAKVVERFIKKQESQEKS